MLKFILSIVSAGITWVLKTLCFYYGWYWYVLPVFPSLPDITKLQAFGLILMLSLITDVSISDMKVLSNEDEYDIVQVYSLLFRPMVSAATLLVFWLVHVTMF